MYFSAEQGGHAILRSKVVGEANIRAGAAPAAPLQRSDYADAWRLLLPRWIEK
jgi:hypothetical protein